MTLIFVYITNPNKAVAKKVALHLLKKRLIGCANIFSVESSYWWKGRIENAKEVVLIVKARKENFNKVKNEVKKIHPYSIPCVVKINVETNKEYENLAKEAICSLECSQSILPV